jgi:hypothetical protein
MRKTTLLLCTLTLCLCACAPREDSARLREVRPFPDPTLGTDNPESQWYKTQILASPSAPPDDATAPARPSGTPAAPKTPRTTAPAAQPVK